MQEIQMRCVCVSLRTSLLLYRGGMPAYALLFECKGTLTRKKEKELYWVLLFVVLHPASSDWWILAWWSRMRYVLL